VVSQYWDDVKKWAAKPYDPNGSVLTWLFFVGLILCCVFLWGRVIRDIVD
jgi:hypothetical protein